MREERDWKDIEFHEPGDQDPRCRIRGRWACMSMDGSMYIQGRSLKFSDNCGWPELKGNSYLLGPGLEFVEGDEEFVMHSDRDDPDIVYLSKENVKSREMDFIGFIRSNPDTRTEARD